MNWAFVGTSTIAKQYMLAAVRAQTNGRVIWIIGSDAERTATYASECDIPMSGTDLGAALSDGSVDAVYISSRNDRHVEQAMLAIKAGKHVLCEKPLATTVFDAQAMVDAAQAAGVVFATNHHLRSAGSHRAIRQLIASGRIGTVLSLRLFHAVQLPHHLRGWRLNDPTAGGGVILDLTVHNADTARFLLGEDPKFIVAHASTTQAAGVVDDSAMSVWSMPSGAMVFSHESFIHPFAASGIEVHGTEGSIIARGVLSQNPVGEIDLIDSRGCTSVPFDRTDLYEAVIRNFEAAATGATTAAASGQDGVKALQIAFAVRRAAESGQRQAVTYGDIQ